MPEIPPPEAPTPGPLAGGRTGSAGHAAAALRWAQLGELVFAAADEKHGYRTVSSALLHPRTEVRQGPLAEESAALLQAFFRARRG